MSLAVNRYKADLREVKFQMFEHFHLHELLAESLFADWDRDDVEMILDGAYKWICEEVGPLNSVGDREGCRLENGKVIAPTGFKKAWDSLYEMGWTNLSAKPEFGGQGGPFVVQAAVAEMLAGANTAFSMYSGLTEGVARVIAAFGTPEQIKAHVGKLHDGSHGGTMCLTEPHAGSDVGAATTKAEEVGDGLYKITGTKIFISAGDHDLAGNIIHLVLARTPGAPAGTKGLSLFIVPRDRLDGSGSNHVTTASLEHKMGINGSSTAVLNFGETGDCIGELVGTELQKGMMQMFKMMNSARIEVGLQGLGIASSAYLNALEYARERKQGPSVKSWKDPDAPKVRIIEHPDVRRMLLEMKAKVEGIRALVFKLANHMDRERVAQGQDDEAVAYHRGQVDLLVPLVKAYSSDEAFQVCATAIQVFGGAGFLKDHPVEQYCRDSKICSIYEGTNHIQALDLVARKLGQRGGANLQAFLKDVNTFVSRHKEHPTLGSSVKQLGQAAETLGATAMRFLGFFQDGKVELVPLHANRFLNMMSEVTVCWLLLQGAVIGDEASKSLADDHADRAFYVGKRYAAIYYAKQFMPEVLRNAEVIGNEDKSSLDIPEESFASI